MIKRLLHHLWSRYHVQVPIILLLVGIITLYAYTLPLEASLYSLRSGVLVIQDFTFYFNLVAAFWMRGASGLYSVDDITQALQALLGESPPAVMPNPTSPTAVIIWLPLVLVAGTSMFHAYLIWMVLSIALLCSVISSSVSRSHLSAQTAAMITCGMFLSLLSNVAQSSAMLGQSSVFATGVLGLLALRLAHRDASDSPDIVLASLLFLSSLKLPYFIIALGMLTVERCWKAIALCGVCLGLCFLIGAWWSSPQWMAGYGATIVRYAFGRFSEGGFYWGDFQSETATWDHISQDLIPSQLLAGLPESWAS